LHWIAFNVNIR